MNWNAIGAVGELLGALGVIVSLLYLSNQLRGSIRQARLDAVRAVQTEIGAVLRSLGASPPLANAYARGVKGWDHLESEGEMMMLSCTYISMLRSYEELIRYRDQGLVDEWAWSSVDSLMKSLMSSKGFADWWSIRGAWFSSEFQRHVEAAVPTTGRDITEEHRSAALRRSEATGSAS